MSKTTASRKSPVEVTVVASLHAPDFTGLARVLLRLSKQSTLKAVPNEQQSSPLPSQFQRPVRHFD